jgi:thiol-disulfide isomerase/thioredoxin
VRWLSPAFARPLEIPLGAVTAVRFTSPGPPAGPQGEFCFELAGDDAVSGDLRAVTSDAIELESPRLGRVKLARDRIRRVYRSGGAAVVYAGPNGLGGWKAAAGSPAWRDEAGQPATEGRGASLFADVGLPEAALVEAELSWKGRPDFVLALGVAENDAADQGIHFEVWGGDLVAVAESARDADLAVVQALSAGEGRVRLRAYLDQTGRRFTVLSPGGRPLAELAVPGKKALPRTGVRLTNNGGDVQLEQLRVTRWTGPPPGDVHTDEPRVRRADGSLIYGTLTAFDSVARQVTVTAGGSETRLRLADLAEAWLANPTPPPAGDGPSPALRVTYRDGSRVSGTLTRVEATHVTLSTPAAERPLRLPLTDLRSLTPLTAPVPSRPPGPDRAGWLEMDGLRLRGSLADGPADAPAALVWRAAAARGAVPIVRGRSGRVVYREQAQPHATPRAVVVPPVVAGAASTGGPAGGLPRPGQKSLHLRSGDTVPCEITRIDERGVTFKTPISAATFVPHDKVKSADLTAAPGDSPAIGDAKRDRLLTLPRVQKGSPPTHLVCSPTGDVLRGRVLEMDDRRVKVEVRLEAREVPRDRVARIIWLHADELPDAKPAAAPRPAAADRVQAVRANGDRLTFELERTTREALAGASDVLGACRVQIADIDQLLFGTAVERAAAELADHRWKLRPAVEPKFAQAEAGGGPASGTDSPLIGQPAPGIKLDLLDGGTFDLAARKGRVVVLDFWATWCGPCLHALPLVDELARTYAERGVDFVAVNMEEQPANVRATLERLKLKSTVALDRDGVVAAKYAVTAIPQTVVIDRDGKVTRLFVGGGKQNLVSLQKALDELAPKKP